MMKKSLIAATLAASFACSAHAQSSVTLYGLLDVGMNYLSNAGGHSQYSMGAGNLAGNRWGMKGSVFLGVAPDGAALPCHAARSLPGLDLPNVREMPLSTIWYESEAFNAFRGERWMREPCRSCDERATDHGGCRCQAYLLTGDARAADPVCAKSPHHGEVERVVAFARQAAGGDERPLVFRSMATGRQAPASSK
jgi:radical SAM protein with 4Fe4S-binding SPASM domain